MKKLSVLAVCVASLSVFAEGAAAPPQLDYREFRKDQSAFLESWREYVAANTAAKDIAVSKQVSDNYFIAVNAGMPVMFGVEWSGASVPKLVSAYDFINQGETPIRLPAELKSQAVIVSKDGKDSIAGVAFGSSLNRSLMALDHADSGKLAIGIGVGHNFDWCGWNCGLTSEFNMVVNGLQVGALSAKATALNGLQVGGMTQAFYSDSIGVQIGILNSNGRFTLPLLNIVW